MEKCCKEAKVRKKRKEGKETQDWQEKAREEFWISIDDIGRARW